MKKYTTIRVLKDKETQQALNFYKKNGIVLTNLTTTLLKNFYKQIKNEKDINILKECLQNKQ